ncbi:MAG: DNA-binding transcriptional regulator [Tepidisphaeraceae bacterium]
MGERSNAIKGDGPRVAILIDTSTGWGRRIATGICNYGKKHGPWHLSIRERGQSERLRAPRGWSGDGVIARVSDPLIAAHVARLGVPIVNISSIHLAGWTFPTVTTDMNAAATLAAEYFAGRGFRQFAYSGAEQYSFVRNHREAFQRALAARGLELAVDRRHATSRPLDSNPKLQAGLTRWLRELPKPVAIFTWSLQRGLEILDACRAGGLVVPHEVAVLAGDYDEVLCEASSPSLSGIVPPSEQIGYEAAALMDSIFAGTAPPKEPILFPPTGIVDNASTDTLAVNDPDLVEVMKFIERRAFDPIGVPDILRAVPVARRTLERKFQQVFGRSAVDEIRHRRINRAKRLLADTDMRLNAIAESCGFCSYTYLSHVFRKSVGVSPSAYRTRARGR